MHSHACVVFRAEELLPEAWAAFAAAGPVRTFNPGLLRDGEGWIFAYRIVGVDGWRRIGLCRLNHALAVVKGSALPLSDLVRFRPGQGYPEMGTRWFADPRLYRFGAQLFIYWNSGWHDPHNCQFVQELDSATLHPRGLARELILDGPRQAVEKNWTFFGEVTSRLHAVYSITPHRVLQFSIEGEGDVFFGEVSRVDWQLEDYPANHGGLRGGAPPYFVDGKFYAFCHSVHDGTEGYRYAPTAYAFAATPPFAPTDAPLRPLSFGQAFGAHRRHGRLNPAVGEVIYPCGAAHDGARWLISHGINDESCAISLVPHVEVLASLRPLAPSE